MQVAIVKYNAGNVRSVDCALRRLGVEATLTDDEETLRRADRVIFPGVGEAGTTMDFLRSKGLDAVIRSLENPVLGIFDVEVKRFQPTRHEDKVPHMGWNTLTQVHEPLCRGFTKDEFVYFVHSYYVPLNPYTAATTEYILPFSAALHKDNFFATQFHPEKSGAVGERILKNFLTL